MMQISTEQEYLDFLKNSADKFSTPLHLNLYYSKYPCLSRAAFQIKYIIGCKVHDLDLLKSEFYKLKVEVIKFLENWKIPEYRVYFKEIITIFNRYYLSLNLLSKPYPDNKGFYINGEEQIEFYNRIEDIYNIINNDSLDECRLKQLKDFKRKLFIFVGEYRKNVGTYYSFNFKCRLELLKIAPGLNYEIDKANKALMEYCEKHNKLIDQTSLYYRLPALQFFINTFENKYLDELGSGIYNSIFFYALKKYC